MIHLQSILVPTDFSKQSRTALQYGIELAKKFNSTLDVLHVVQDVAVFLPETAVLAPSVAVAAFEPLLQAARKLMEEFLQPFQNQGVPFHSHCEEGNPLDEILQFAEDKKVDLIIIGTHGHTGFAHMVLGSVAEAVVRRAPCPVLTVRNPEHEFVSPGN
ncbi:MAG: universal stress protein [Gemmataceae bacterium]|nr:universal stress protein [Gemmataceae bacterium]